MLRSFHTLIYLYVDKYNAISREYAIIILRTWHLILGIPTSASSTLEMDIFLTSFVIFMLHSCYFHVGALLTITIVKKYSLFFLFIVSSWEKKKKTLSTSFSSAQKMKLRSLTIIYLHREIILYSSIKRFLIVQNHKDYQ